MSVIFLAPFVLSNSRVILRLLIVCKLVSFFFPNFFFFILLAPPETWSVLTNLTKLDISTRFDYNYQKDEFLIQDSNIKYLTNLRTLKLGPSSPSYSLESLSQLVHLQKLVFYNCLYDHNYAYPLLDLLDTLPSIKTIYLDMSKDHSCSHLQRKYPHVRFRWWHEEDDTFGKDYSKKEESKIGYYEGEFSTNIYNSYQGKGFLKQDHYTYEGDFESGLPNGRGVFTYVYQKNQNESNSMSSKRYDGEVKNSKMHGKGVLEYFGGSRYEGNFVEGKKEGKGILYFLDEKCRYEGQFSDDKFFGNGKFFYEGHEMFGGKFFSDGRASGTGYIDMERNMKFVSEIELGFDSKCGHFLISLLNGKLFYSNGLRFEGRFSKASPEEGILYYPNGDRYEGK